MTPEEITRLKVLTAEILSAYNQARSILRGRHCTVHHVRIHGKWYDNREGEIEDVAFDPSLGFLPVVYITRISGGGDHRLNSEGSTRQAWSLDELDIE